MWQIHAAHEQLAAEDEVREHEGWWDAEAAYCSPPGGLDRLEHSPLGEGRVEAASGAEQDAEGAQLASKKVGPIGEALPPGASRARRHASQERSGSLVGHDACVAEQVGSDARHAVEAAVADEVGRQRLKLAAGPAAGAADEDLIDDAGLADLTPAGAVGGHRRAAAWTAGSRYGSFSTEGRVLRHRQRARPRDRHGAVLPPRLAAERPQLRCRNESVLNERCRSGPIRRHEVMPVTSDLEDSVNRFRFLIRDRNSKFTSGLVLIIEARTPSVSAWWRAPNLRTAA